MFWLAPRPASLKLTTSAPLPSTLEVAKMKWGLAGTIRSSRDSRVGLKDAGRLCFFRRGRSHERNMVESPSEGVACDEGSRALARWAQSEPQPGCAAGAIGRAA